jgi:hypothetical protein
LEVSQERRGAPDRERVGLAECGVRVWSPSPRCSQMWGWFLVNDALLPSIKIWYAFGVPSKKKKRCRDIIYGPIE